MKISFHIASMAAIIFLLISCSSTGYYSKPIIHHQSITNTVPIPSTYNQKSPRKISLYTNNQKLHMPYRIIGVATVSKYNAIGIPRKETTIHDIMKNIAASMGGDALINFTNNTNSIQAHIIQFQKILI